MRKKLLSLLCLMPIGVLAISCSAPPAIQNVELDPQPSDTAPLAARVTFQTDRPTTVALEFADGQRAWTVATRLPASTDHVVPILGLRAGRTQTVRVVATDDRGRTAASAPLEITTDPLPDNFPPLDVRVSIPDRMEPGYTLIEPSYLPEDGSQDSNWLIAVDETGEVVWYYEAPHGVSDAQRLRNGNLLYRSGTMGLYEIDMLGNRVAHWRSNLTPDDQITADSIHVATDTLHHEALETPTGNIMALSTEARTYDDYPTSETDPEAPAATATVVGDLIVEFTRQGRIVREIKLLDVFDPYRIGYGSIETPYWRGTYPAGASDARDWSHSNGIKLDETGRYLLVSMRHQSAVAKLDIESNEIVWILGDHGGWGPEWQTALLEPEGDVIWPADQHAPMYTPEGTVLMFDNGTNRALPFDAPMPVAESFSRAVEYGVDEQNKKVREVWSYGGPGDERFYSWRVGDADWMPATGNVLITFGGMSKDAAGNTSEGNNGHHWVRIVEVTRDTPAEKVFELFIDDRRPRGWLSFQAERIASLYP